jgi:hypothetical protein
MIRKRAAENVCMRGKYQDARKVSTQTTQNQQPHPEFTGRNTHRDSLDTEDIPRLCTRQKVGNLKPEHFGQLG